jgi:molecular chaperone GrpE
MEENINVEAEHEKDNNETNIEMKEQEEKGKKHSKKAKKEQHNDSEELQNRIAELEEAIAQKDDQYLRLQAEFDNYRKRTLKEKMELTKTATSDVMVSILTVVDDFDRALQVIETSTDPQAVKEGINLIYKRFIDFLKQRGVSEMEAKEKELDTDLHEAITKIPAPTEELKGKIVDVVQKGYYLNDKVIRFAKVVIGE